jgi:hypothetical protein
MALPVETGLIYLDHECMPLLEPPRHRSRPGGRGQAPVPAYSRREKLIFALCDALRFAHQKARRVTILAAFRGVAWALACYADQIEMRTLCR